MRFGSGFVHTSGCRRGAARCWGRSRHGGAGLAAAGSGAEVPDAVGGCLHVQRDRKKNKTNLRRGRGKNLTARVSL